MFDIFVGCNVTSTSALKIKNSRVMIHWRGRDCRIHLYVMPDNGCHHIIIRCRLLLWLLGNTAFSSIYMMVCYQCNTINTLIFFLIFVMLCYIILLNVMLNAHISNVISTMICCIMLSYTKQYYIIHVYTLICCATLRIYCMQYLLTIYAGMHRMLALSAFIENLVN